MLEFAAEMCLCVPWDYPRFPNSKDVEICNFYGYYCFDQVMRNTSHSKECQGCMPDCNVVDYQVRKEFSELNKM